MNPVTDAGQVQRRAVDPQKLSVLKGSSRPGVELRAGRSPSSLEALGTMASA